MKRMVMVIVNDDNENADIKNQVLIITALLLGSRTAKTRPYWNSKGLL
jgi:hypothetical protein